MARALRPFMLGKCSAGREGADARSKPGGLRCSVRSAAAATAATAAFAVTKDSSVYALKSSSNGIKSMRKVLV